MSEDQALYLFKGKRVLVNGKPGTVVQWSPSRTVTVKLDEGIVWIGPYDQLSDAEKRFEPPWRID